MRAFRMGRDLAERHAMQPGSDLDPVLRSLGLEVVPWRFRGRLREVIFEGAIGIDESLLGELAALADRARHRPLTRCTRARASTWRRGSG